MQGILIVIGKKMIVAAKVLWDYMKFGQPPKPVDVLFVLSSRDDRVAEYGAELYGRGISKLVLISGDIAHKKDLLAAKWDESKAEHFADIMITRNVPAGSIILEDSCNEYRRKYILGFE